jgi:hypothetical protein
MSLLNLFARQSRGILLSGINKNSAPKRYPEHKPNIGHELLDVPMGDMIRDMAFAIADAQLALDANSIEVAQMLGGLKQIVNEDGEVLFADSRVFFGKEKLQLRNAIDFYNASNDMDYRARILNELSLDAYEYNCIECTSSDTKTKLEKDPLVTTIGDIYALKGFTAFYKYEGDTTTKPTSKILSPPLEKYKVPIKRADKASMESVISIPTRVSMLELGFTPTFYQFVDTIIEVKISISYTSETSNVENKSENNNSSVGGGIFSFFGGPKCTRTSNVNATYSQKFNYSSEGSSLLRTKLVPIPPPAILEERIRALMVAAKEESANNPVSTTDVSAPAPPAS